MVVLVAGCGKLEQPASTPATRLAPAAEQRLVRISRFDCVKKEDVEDAARFPWSLGISLWQGGGPGGATWNAVTLTCALEFQTNCQRGEADAEVRIGATLGSSRRVKIERSGVQMIRFELMDEQWQPGLDQGSELSQRFPYQTATFGVALTATCDAPTALAPGLGPRLEFADHRHFTAGFAGGE